MPPRVGERVWVWNAGWQRAFGTAAEYVALPAEQAVRLPDAVSFAEGACFGIPAMTAWYAVMGDGPLAGQTVLVTGGAGTVGALRGADGARGRGAGDRDRVLGGEGRRIPRRRSGSTTARRMWPRR